MCATQSTRAIIDRDCESPSFQGGVWSVRRAELGDDAPGEVVGRNGSGVALLSMTTETQRDEVPDETFALASDAVRRRIWLLHMADRHLPFEQALEWARSAEAFITSSLNPEPIPSEAFEASSASHSTASGSQGHTPVREAVLQLIKGTPQGLSRREILERLQVKGDKARETSVSNALQALVKKHEVVRREHKYCVQDEAG
jgi:hypothetical protein